MLKQALAGELEEHLPPLGLVAEPKEAQRWEPTRAEGHQGQQGQPGQQGQSEQALRELELLPRELGQRAAGARSVARGLPSARQAAHQAL